jgi:hypothetical protein
LEPLRVRTKNKPVHVLPGQESLLVIEAHVPAKLPRRRNFIGKTSVYKSTLTFELLASLQPIDEL